MKQGLYLPACTGFITGIEASIRNTMAEIKNRLVLTMSMTFPL